MSGIEVGKLSQADGRLRNHGPLVSSIEEADHSGGATRY